MNLPFPPLPPDEPEISLPAFLKRLDAEPDFARKMQAHYESHLQEHHPENVQAAARQALLTLKHRRGLVGAHKRQMAMMELLGGDANKELRAETVARLGALREGAMHFALDILEPERTQCMKRLVATEEFIRTLEQPDESSS